MFDYKKNSFRKPKIIVTNGTFFRGFRVLSVFHPTDLLRLLSRSVMILMGTEIVSGAATKATLVSGKTSEVERSNLMVATSNDHDYSRNDKRVATRNADVARTKHLNVPLSVCQQNYSVFKCK